MDRELAAADRLRYGWEKLGAAYSLVDADEVITEGRWAGFTRGDAIAWSWHFGGLCVSGDALHSG